MKILYMFVFNLLTVSTIYCLKVKSVCTLAKPSVCSLKYSINQLEKHQINDAIKSWANDTSILDKKFRKEFDHHPLIKLFIQNQANLSIDNPAKTFTVGNLKNLEINNLNL